MKKLTAAVMLAAILIVGCSGGQDQAPTLEEIQEEVQFIEVTRPDGLSMSCLVFTDKGWSTAGYSGYSWFGIDCDWG